VLTIAMTTRSKAELFLLGEPVPANYHNYIIMHLGPFHYLQLRQLRRQSFAVTITKIANECLKNRIPIK